LSGRNVGHDRPPLFRRLTKEAEGREGQKPEKADPVSGVAHAREFLAGQGPGLKATLHR
jgi:hypothetical protein